MNSPLNLTVERRQFLWNSLSLAGVGLVAGCGTVLHPERRGQAAGSLDWKIVALDAIGLVFFFVPGVVAFAVDFATGAIYLPPEQCTQHSPTNDDGLVVTQLPPDSLSKAEIEAVVSREIDQPVKLEPGRFRSRPLSRLKEFWSSRSEFETRIS